jgi:hypothetical protein
MTDSVQIRIIGTVGGTAEQNIIRSVKIEGTGTNPFPTSNCIALGYSNKDAFYENYNNGTANYQGIGEGLQIDKGSGFTDPTAIPPYSPSHMYEFYEQGNGNAWAFKLGDSDYTNNELGYFVVVICGDGLNQ